MLKQTDLLPVVLACLCLCGCVHNGTHERCVSSATASVHILDPAMFMPPLGVSRCVRVYLPPGYVDSERRYPVLYLHDGQNVFDTCASRRSEWGVDETLDSLHARGGHGVIVVAVDHGNERRWDEYGPWGNATYGGGDASAYVSFLVATLKPRIDSLYRTLPDARHTCVMGASMGGLVSLYAALLHPDVFGSAGVFSPSLWFSDSVYAFARAHASRGAAPRLYFVSGMLEERPGQPPGSYVRNQSRLVDTLVAAGVPPARIAAHARADGTHTEWFWRREFTAAYLWLLGSLGPEPGG